jgi:polysaccharide pyruvyl transferase WcaK-like protein
LDQSPHGDHAAIGVSIGPYRDAAAPDRIAALLPRFQFVGLRDAISLERANQLAPTANASLTFDLAPLLNSADSEPDAGRLGVALCASATSAAQLKQLADVLKQWLAVNASRRLVLLPFNVHPRKGDTSLHYQLRDLVGEPGRTELVLYNGDPIATWQQVGRLSGLLAMRLHAAVFGYCNQVPTILLPYEEKCHQWAAMIRHPAALISEMDSLDADMLQQIAVGSAWQPGLSLADARTAAGQNFEALKI